MIDVYNPQKLPLNRGVYAFVTRSGVKIGRTSHFSQRKKALEAKFGRATHIVFCPATQDEVLERKVLGSIALAGLSPMAGNEFFAETTAVLAHIKNLAAQAA